LERLRTPLFIIALILIAIVFLAEIGSSLLGGGVRPDAPRTSTAARKAILTNEGLNWRVVQMPSGMGFLGV
jgi:hypothetical protein